MEFVFAVIAIFAAACAYVVGYMRGGIAQRKIYENDELDWEQAREVLRDGPYKAPSIHVDDEELTRGIKALADAEPIALMVGGERESSTMAEAIDRVKMKARDDERRQAQERGRRGYTQEDNEEFLERVKIIGEDNE